MLSRFLIHLKHVEPVVQVREANRFSTDNLLRSSHLSQIPFYVKSIFEAQYHKSKLVKIHSSGSHNFEIRNKKPESLENS